MERDMMKPFMRLRTERELERLRENLERYGRARAIRDQMVQGASPWLDRADAFLRKLIPGPEVPRSFYVHFKGCPVQGGRTRYRRRTDPVLPGADGQIQGAPVLHFPGRGVPKDLHRKTEKKYHPGRRPEELGDGQIRPHERPIAQT